MVRIGVGPLRAGGHLRLLFAYAKFVIVGEGDSVAINLSRLWRDAES